MLDTTSSYRKQEAAIKALGCFVSSTGYVIRPYMLYPQLLPQSLNTLCKHAESQPASLRLELLRTLGLLGALDPSRFVTVTDYLEQREKKLKSGKRSAILGSLSIAEGDVCDPGDDDGSQESDNDVSYKGRGGKSIIGADDDPDRTSSDLNEFNSNSIINSAMRKRRISKRLSQQKSPHPTGAFPGLIQAEASSLMIADNAEEPAHLFMYEQSFSRCIPEPPVSEITVRHIPSSDDFYPKVAIAALVKVLQDNSSAVSVHHSTATNTIIKIFRTMGVRCVPFLEQIVPYFLQVFV